MRAIRGGWLWPAFVLAAGTALAGSAMAGSAMAAEPAKTAPQTAAQWHDRGNELRSRGQYDAALESYKKALELDPKLADCFVDRAVVWNDRRNTQAALADCDRALELKPKHARAYNIRGLAYQFAEQYESAIGEFNRALEIDPRYAAAISNRAACQVAIGKVDLAIEQLQAAIGELPAKDAETLAAGMLHRQAGYACYAKDDYRSAVSQHQQALAIFEKVSGLADVQVAQTCDALGDDYRVLARYADAERIIQRALAIWKAEQGEQNEDYARSTSKLADVYHEWGRYTDSEACAQRVIAIRTGLFGPDDLRVAGPLAFLGHIQSSHLGQPAEAEVSEKRALAIRERHLPPTHPDIGGSLVQLGAIYSELGLHAEAERMLQRAVSIFEQASPRSESNLAWGLTNLGLALQSSGKLPEAEAAMRQALKLRRSAGAPLFVAKSLSNLANVLTDRGAFAEAKGLLEEGLAMHGQIGQLENDHSAVLYRHLGEVHFALAEFDPAKQAFAEALRLRNKHCGAGSHWATEMAARLAAAHEMLGEDASAAALLLTGLQDSRRNMELAAELQSEDRQLVMARSLRYLLDRYISLLARTSLPRDAAYDLVLRWKGSIFTRQWRSRLANEQPALKPLVAELDQVARELAQFVFASARGEGSRPDAAQHLRNLLVRQQVLEIELAGKSQPFRDQRSQAARTAAQIAAALPDDTCLVDLLEYTDYTPLRLPGAAYLPLRRLMAFVVRRGEPVKWVSLGAAVPVTRSITNWRKTFGVGNDALAAAQELRKQIWEPLEPELRGVRTVLISPDGALTRFPLAALPGRKPDTYLIDQWAIAVIPVPQLLPELMAPAKPSAERAGALLVIGDVDYDCDTNQKPVAAAATQQASAPQVAAQDAPRPAKRGQQQFHFDHLWNTSGEALYVQYSFKSALGGEAQMLLGGEATEARFRELAPASRYLHLATHGFFSPAEVGSALNKIRGGANPVADDPANIAADAATSGVHPGLLSGIVLAGANHLPKAGEDDGIVTAEEVARLDLHRVDLAVLSACDTGLGEVAGGEGVLGLQRAFQAAGARSTVASLWQIPDDATRALMERFYSNLWTRHMAKAEALREAQLWMLAGIGVRGLKLTPETPADSPRRLPPFYWAAFVLSGSWQ